MLTAIMSHTLRQHRDDGLDVKIQAYELDGQNRRASVIRVINGWFL
jgi:hypothetical protein